MFKARTRAAHNLSRLFAPALCTLLQPGSPPGRPKELRTGNDSARQAQACMTMDAHSGSCVGARVWPEGVPNLRNEAVKAVLPAAAVATESKAKGAGILPLNIAMIVRPLLALVLQSLCLCDFAVDTTGFLEKGVDTPDFWKKVAHACHTEVCTTETVLVLRRQWGHRATYRCTAETVSG